MNLIYTFGKRANSTMYIVTLIASIPRIESLFNVSLPSVIAQTYLPNKIVLVTDNIAITEHELTAIKALVAPIQITVLVNQRAQGAAGSWNTGLNYIAHQFEDCYVAILDDDDCWHSNHLEQCISHSKQGKADVVLSGMSVIREGKLIATNTPTNIVQSDFLVGNPGWQGSNTFCRLQLLKSVGGFTDGLISSNDKDLAIRILAIPEIVITYTQTVTVTWNLGVHSNALSARGSRQKIKGCAQFLSLYGKLMSAEQQHKYFERTLSKFDITKQVILNELNTNKDIRIVAGSLF